MSYTVLQINSSARIDGSVTRDLTAQIAERHPDARIVSRDLAATPIPQISETWVNANFTPEDQRSAAQKDVLALSDELIAEIKQADVIVIGVPIYNFSVPASLKAWIDHIARAGVTFRYSETSPKGLLEGKSAVIAMASGGVPIDAPVDFATPYMRHVLGFIGITDITVVAADQMMVDAEASQSKAQDAIAALPAAA
jgi:FMN-dependent NADH-azoreductase